MFNIQYVKKSISMNMILIGVGFIFCEVVQPDAFIHSKALALAGRQKSSYNILNIFRNFFLITPRP